jgi:hypothetical protein
MTRFQTFFGVSAANTMTPVRSHSRLRHAIEMRYKLSYRRN